MESGMTRIRSGINTAGMFPPNVWSRPCCLLWEKISQRMKKSLPLDGRGPVFQRDAFPWGLCPAQRIEIFMTAGGSHTITKWHGASHDGWGAGRTPDFVCRGGGMPRPLEFYTQKQMWPCLPLRGRWHAYRRAGGSVPGSIGHSPSHGLRHDSPPLGGGQEARTISCLPLTREVARRQA